MDCHSNYNPVSTGYNMPQHIPTIGQLLIDEKTSKDKPQPGVVTGPRCLRVLGKEKQVKVQEWQGQLRVDIRQWVARLAPKSEGALFPVTTYLPTKKGVVFPLNRYLNSWRVFRPVLHEDTIATRVN